MLSVITERMNAHVRTRVRKLKFATSARYKCKSIASCALTVNITLYINYGNRTYNI